MEPVVIRQRLRDALSRAMKERDMAAVAALRSTIAAIDNAEAVDRSTAPAAGDGVIAQAVSGVGAAEAERRTLTEDDVVGIVRAEVADRVEAADGYERAGRMERAERLRAEVAVLDAVLTLR
jgi:uncharacterized protein YqeY